MSESDISKIEKFEREKKLLKRYKKNRACISRLKDKLDNINTRLVSIRTSKFSDMPKGGLGKTIDDFLSEKEDLEKRIAKLEKSGEEIKDKTYDIIDTINEPHLVELMEYLFIKCYDIEDLEDILGISKRQLLRRYRRALELVHINEEDY